MNPTEKRSGAHHFLYDADLLDEVDASLFEPSLLARDGRLCGVATGRGTTHFFELDDRQYALRHYRRGGKIAALLGDRYLRIPIRRTRPWREWHLLARIAELGLPAPIPVAARVITTGLFYRADLVTLRIRNASPLAEILRCSPLENGKWRAIGATIRRFHDSGVLHPDLNARNILLGECGEIHLIDFDKGEISATTTGRQQSNLVRLHRSLNKLHGKYPSFRFTEEGWLSLLDGWHGR